MQKLRIVCVFCGADDKVSDEYKQVAYACGSALAKSGLALLSGGNNTGLLCSLIDGHADTGPDVPRYAAIPEAMRTLAIDHPRIPAKNLMWTEDLYDRLKTFHGMCDVVVVLPGGFGTLHEFMDFLVLSQCGLIKKQIFVLNIDGYWDPLLAQFARMVQKHTLSQTHLDYITVVQTLDELMHGLTTESNL